MTRYQVASHGRPTRRFRRRRSGMILAMVLVALLIVMLLGAALANAFLAQRQLARHRAQQQQAFWLAESALQRAAYRLASEAEYEGETWHAAPESLAGTHAGTTIIRVEAVTEPQPGHFIFVDASYPRDTAKQSVQHRELFVAKSSDVAR